MAFGFGLGGVFIHIADRYVPHDHFEKGHLSPHRSTKPVFVKKDGSPVFVIRQGPRTIKLTFEEQYKYISQHFPE